jgi:hypothetical protein
MLDFRPAYTTEAAMHETIAWYEKWLGHAGGD